MIIVATQSLNPGCDPYLNANDTPIVYKPLFFSTTNGSAQAVVTEEGFESQLNIPPSGQAWFSSTQTNQGLAGIQQIQSIKLSQLDVTGTEVINYLDDFENLRVIFPDAVLPYNVSATEYIITGRTLYADHIILQVSQTEGNNFYQVIGEGPASTIYFPITSSVNGGSMNWSLRARTNYNTPFSGVSSVNSESVDTLQQGVCLNTQQSIQEQNFFYWDGEKQDALGFFNTGSNLITTNKIFYIIGKRK